MPILPRTQVPPLSFETVGGSTWDLADQANENFTLIVVFRGYH